MSGARRRQAFLGYDGEAYGETAERRRLHRLLVTFYGAVCAATAGEPHVQLATCEKVPIVSDETAPSVDSAPAYLGGSDVERAEYVETAEELDHTPDALEALQAAMARDRERQEKVLELIQVGEVAHAKRLAMCGRQSVQLQCGHCESDENYVPVSCDSRLCPDCMKSQMGRKAAKYQPALEAMDDLKMLRLSLPYRVDADRESLQEAVDELRDGFSRLRRRKLPLEGVVDWDKWKSALHAHGYHDLVRRLQKRFVDHPRRKGPRVDEFMVGGLYGIDIKQQDDGRLYIHMHIIADMPYLPRSVLSAMWDDVMDAPVVDIRQIDSGDQDEDAESAFMEVVGYAAKPPEFESVEAEVAYLETLKGTKLVQPFGDLHGNTPSSVSELRCCSCEESPEEWYYLGVVDGNYETAVVHGSDGDRPPPA